MIERESKRTRSRSGFSAEQERRAMVMNQGVQAGRDWGCGSLPSKKGLRRTGLEKMGVAGISLALIGMLGLSSPKAGEEGAMVRKSNRAHTAQEERGEHGGASRESAHSDTPGSKASRTHGGDSSANAPSMTLKETQALMAQRNDPIDTLRGEVVDITCYVAMGDSALGPKHAQCGAECLRKGLPVGLMTAERHIYLVVMHNHTSANRLLARHTGAQVEVAGIQRKRGGLRVFEITSFIRRME